MCNHFSFNDATPKKKKKKWCHSIVFPENTVFVLQNVYVQRVQQDWIQHTNTIYRHPNNCYAIYDVPLKIQHTKICTAKNTVRRQRTKHGILRCKCMRFHDSFGQQVNAVHRRRGHQSSTLEPTSAVGLRPMIKLLILDTDGAKTCKAAATGMKAKMSSSSSSNSLE